MNTKEKILSQSLILFNQDGVENITTRHIAKALGISQGNLHYHYPNKNSLITRLFEQFIAEIKSAARYNPEESFEKEAVLKSMADNFKIMYQYRFLFKDNELVWRRVPTIKEQIIQFFDSKRKEIKALILHYKREGIFRADISDQQIDYLANQFVFSISSWLVALEYITPFNENSPKYFTQFTFRLWLPYLKEAEMKKWEALL